MNQHIEQARTLWPGVVVSGVVAVAAMFLAEHHGAPVMLLALLLGMALNFLTQPEAGQRSRSAAGIDFTAKAVLRLGVALLGLRITLDQVLALGWQPIAMVVLAVALTIVCGIVLARLMGFQMFFGLLTGGAVAICGASAALALSAAMPSHPRKEQATLRIGFSNAIGRPKKGPEKAPDRARREPKYASPGFWRLGAGELAGL